MLSTAVYKSLEKSNNEILNEKIAELLRGELAAVEAVEQVFEIASDKYDLDILNRLRLDHERAVAFWKSHIDDSFVPDQESSGIWGSFVEAFIGSSKLIGDKTTLEALRIGEDYGLNEYRSFSERYIIPKEISVYLNEFLIPIQKKHVELVNRMIHSHS